MQINAFPGYLFDVDGTLVDTAPDIRLALNYALESAGYEAVSEEQTKGWIGHGARRLVQQALAEQSVASSRQEEVYVRYLDHYDAHIADNSRPYPEVVSGLQSLTMRGAKLGVVTNKLGDQTRKLLTKLRLARFFRCVIGGDSTHNPKPAADPILLGCRMLELSPQQVLVVGDSVTDVVSAKAAGCPVVCVPHGYNGGVAVEEFGADAVIKSLNDLTTTCS